MSLERTPGQKFARFSLMFGVGFVVFFMLYNPRFGMAYRALPNLAAGMKPIVPFCQVFLMGGGLLTALLAFAGMKNQGPHGIFGPALFGLLISLGGWGLFIADFVAGHR
jgi:hypothetical protein